MAWTILLLASVFEVGWAIGLRYTEGFTRLLPSILTIICILLSMYFLSMAVRTLPLGTAYTIWTGIGIIGTAAFGIYLFGESTDPVRLFFLALILVGIVGLKWMTP